MKYLGRIGRIKLGIDTDYEEYWGNIENFLVGHPYHLVRHLIQQDQSWGFVRR